MGWYPLPCLRLLPVTLPSNIIPKRLARFGSYHSPFDDGLDNVCRFTCKIEGLNWYPSGPSDARPHYHSSGGA